MRRYFVADRNRNKLRAAVDWQANEQFSLQGELDFNKDDFSDSVYGLQDAKGWALSLDGTYAASENLVVSALLYLRGLALHECGRCLWRQQLHGLRGASRQHDRLGRLLRHGSR